MNPEEIIRQKKEIEEEFGPWTAYGFKLPGNVHILIPRFNPDIQNLQHTSTKLKPHEDYKQWEGYSGSFVRVQRYLQTISDISKKPLGALRILDLGCGEGGVAIELAAQGATVVGIEGRETTIVKANFVKEALSLKKLEFIQDDVRNINEQPYGRFDVILCIGILYHLNVPDVFHLLEKIFQMCDMFTIVDTELSTNPVTSFVYNGKTYWGNTCQEHNHTATPEEKLKNVYMSLDNIESFCFTRFSLFNFLQHVGFSSVYECFIPPVLGHGASCAFVAMKGTKAKLLTPANSVEAEEYTEINSDRNDSELHLLEKTVRLREHPRAGRLRRSLNQARRGASRLLKKSGVWL